MDDGEWEALQVVARKCLRPRRMINWSELGTEFKPTSAQDSIVGDAKCKVTPTRVCISETRTVYRLKAREWLP